MIGFISPGVVIALAALVVVLLVLVVKMFLGKPKRAEKWEKAAIMKQLLDLSDQQEGRRLVAPAARPRTQTARPVARANQPPLKATTKIAMQARSKVR
jgi:hypothetical protein